MGRLNIGTMWDRNNRNNMNDNFIELYQKYQEYFTEITEDLREELIAGSHIDIKGYVQAVTNLPRSAEDGDTYFVTATGEWQRWNGEEWEAIAKTDPSEFIALKEDFDNLESNTTDLITSLNEDFTNFKLDIDNKIDTQIGEIDDAVQAFITSIGDQVVYVEEEGSNANGSYVRYSDGWQVCWHTIEGLIPDEARGSLYISPSERWDLPKPFKGVGEFWVSLDVYSVARWALPSGLTDAGSFAFRQVAATRQATSDYPTFLKAEGWWK